MLRRLKMALPLLFAFILTFLPFQLLRFTQSQRNSIQQQRNHYLWEQKAHNYLQKFSTCWSYDLQFQRLNEEFRRKVGSEILNSRDTERTLAFHVKNTFKGNFSLAKIYGCELNKKNQKLKIFAHLPFESKKRVVYKHIFSGLLSGDHPDFKDEKRINSFIIKEFGEDIDLRLLKIHRRAKIAYVFWQNKNMALIWDKFENNDKAIAYLYLFFPDRVSRKHSMLSAMQKLSEDYSDVFAAAVPISGAENNNPVVYSPQTGKNVKRAVQRLLKLSDDTMCSRSELMPIGTLVTIDKLVHLNGYHIVREFVDFNLPYELWMFRKTGDAKSSNFEQNIIVLLNMFFYFSWLVVFVRVFITARPLGFSLENWLKLIFIVIGVVPLIALYIAGSFHIESTAFTEEQQTIRETVKLFEEADVSGESVLAEFRRVCRNLEQSAFWKNAMLQWNVEAWKDAIERLPEYFADAGLEITACYVFPPPVSDLSYYYQTFNPLSSGRDDSLSAMYYDFMRFAYSKVAPHLAIEQEYKDFLFGNQESEEALRIMLGNRGDVDTLIMGDDRQFFYQNYVLENGYPKNWFCFRSNLNQSMADYLKRKIIAWNNHNEDILFGLVRKNYPEIEYIYPARRQSAGSKMFARFRHHAGKIIDIAGVTSARILEYDDQNLVFVYPCRTSGDYILAAIISFRNLRQKSFHRELILGIILILLGIPVFATSNFMVRYLVWPLKQVESGLKKVAEDDFSSRMKTRRKDELGDLAMAFDEMVDGIIERKNLGKFVSSNLDVRVAEENSLLAGKLEKNFAAVLCSDIRSFTTLSEEYEVREIVEMLNVHLTKMSECIRNHGGLVEQFIGDAVLAVFFADTEKQAVDNAVEAAKSMMISHRKLLEKRKSEGRFIYDIGIGIEADRIISGAVKLGEKSEYVLVGKARYMAEELEGKTRFAKHSRIFCSTSVKRLASGQFFELAEDGQSWELIHGDESV